MTSVEHMPSIALRWIKEGKKVAQATVISTWGSAPRPVGAQLAIDEDGVFFGSVSGGCVEGAVILEAQEALRDGQCRILDYGVADEDAFAVGLACGGNIQILVEPINIGQGPKTELIEALVAAFEARKPIALRIDFNNWSREFLTEDAILAGLSHRGENGFIGVYNPPLRMAIVGAVHITQTLAPLARMAGFEVQLVDPRDSFASAQRFPNETFVDAWPDEAMGMIGLDKSTAVITLSHDPKMDTPALAEALKSDAFYIGALGSKKTHAKRVLQLTELGFSEADIARIHGPIGTNIGAKTPAEIAISIMAEVTERLRRPETRP